eukprot:g11462.t1
MRPRSAFARVRSVYACRRDLQRAQSAAEAARGARPQSAPLTQTATAPSLDTLARIALDTEADLKNVFHMLDFQNNGSVSVEEFALGIQMFSGGAKSIDVARLMFEVTTIKKYMTDMYDARRPRIWRTGLAHGDVGHLGLLLAYVFTRGPRGAGRGLSGCKKGHRDLADDEGFIGIVLKEHLRELAAKKNAAEEAKRKKKKTLEAIESHTAAFGRHAARTRESLAALEEALASHDDAGTGQLGWLGCQCFMYLGDEKGLQLKKAKDQWKDLDGQVQVLEGELTKAKERAEAKMEEMTEQLQAQEAQVEKVKAERDEAEKAMEEKDLELQKAKTWRGQMLEAHDKAEAEMHAARTL